MSMTDLRKIWIGFASLCTLVALNFMAISQGWNMTFGAKLFVDIDLEGGDRNASSVIGLAVVSVLYACVAGLALSHAQRMTGPAYEKMPLRVLSIAPNSREGRRIQIGGLICFFAIPLYAIGHFWRKMLASDLCKIEGWAYTRRIPKWSLDWLSPWPWSNDFRIGEVGHACQGVTFQPFLQPLLVVLVCAFGLYQTGLFLLELRKG